MFDFLKPKTHPLQVAWQLARYISVYDFEAMTAQLVEKQPELSTASNAIIDETQWLLVASGLIGIRIAFNLKAAHSVLAQLDILYSTSTGEGGNPQTRKQVDAILLRLNTYLASFDSVLIDSISKQTLPNLAIELATNRFSAEALQFFKSISSQSELEGFFKKMARHWVPLFRNTYSGMLFVGSPKRDIHVEVADPQLRLSLRSVHLHDNKAIVYEQIFEVHDDVFKKFKDESGKLYATFLYEKGVRKLVYLSKNNFVKLGIEQAKL